MGSTTIWDTVRLALAIALGTLALGLAKVVYERRIRPTRMLKHFPGPVGHEMIRGDAPKIFMEEAGKYISPWHREYGRVVRHRGPLGSTRLSIADRGALQHILLNEPFKFPKPGLARGLLGPVLGNGVLLAEGPTHTRQRKIMNPSFGPAHMKTLYSVFDEKARRLRDFIVRQMSDNSEKTTKVDIYEYANRATLDVIGLAGFGYEPNAIELGNGSELAAAFDRLFGASASINLVDVIFIAFPFLNHVLPAGLSERRAARDQSMALMQRIGKDLVAEKKATVLSEGTSKASVGSTHMAGRDLLSVLVKANMAADLKPSQKMTDEEVMAQITTFLLAGNDTTANSISWAVYALCKYPETQRKLREELLAVQTDEPTYDELMGLPYLDAVIRETLRLYSPVAGTTRVATEDHVVPLSKPVVDNEGKKHDAILVPKDTVLYVPIVTLNRDAEFWGPDAEEFNPERWIAVDKLPEGANELPSIQMPTFLAGSRACIGFRFSLIEMKTIQPQNTWKGHKPYVTTSLLESLLG